MNHAHCESHTVQKTRDSSVDSVLAAPNCIMDPRGSAELFIETGSQLETGLADSVMPPSSHHVFTFCFLSDVAKQRKTLLASSAEVKTHDAPVELSRHTSTV